MQTAGEQSCLALRSGLLAQAAGFYKTHESEIPDVAPVGIAIADGYDSAGEEGDFADDIGVRAPEAEHLHIPVASDAVSLDRTLPFAAEKPALHITFDAIMTDQAPLAHAGFQIRNPARR